MTAKIFENDLEIGNWGQKTNFDYKRTHQQSPIRLKNYLKGAMKDITEKLGKISEKVNGITGRLIVPATEGNIAIKEAHKMSIEVGIEIDDLINEIL